MCICKCAKENDCSRCKLISAAPSTPDCTLKLDTAPLTQPSRNKGGNAAKKKKNYFTKRRPCGIESILASEVAWMCFGDFYETPPSSISVIAWSDLADQISLSLCLPLFFVYLYLYLYWGFSCAVKLVHRPSMSLHGPIWLTQNHLFIKFHGRVFYKMHRESLVTSNWFSFRQEVRVWQKTMITNSWSQEPNTNIALPSNMAKTTNKQKTTTTTTPSQTHPEHWQ